MPKLPGRTRRAAEQLEARLRNPNPLAHPLNGELRAEQIEWDTHAEQELTGGFDPDDVCPDCHIARSKSGACDC